MSAAGKAFRRWVPVLVIVIGLVTVSALIWTAIKEFAGQDQGRKKRVIHEISLVKPPPPPPPPPKVQEPPKPEIKDEIKEPDPSPEPEKQAEAPPPDSGIPEGPVGGMATDIGAGTGAGVIGGGGGGGNRFAWYGALVKERIQETVDKNDKLRAADYRVLVNVWVDSNGIVTRAELTNSTGDATLDDALRVALSAVPRVGEGAPGDMPQPIKLRITARS